MSVLPGSHVALCYWGKATAAARPPDDNQPRTTGTPIMSVQQHCVDTIRQTSQRLKNAGWKTIQNAQSRVSKMRELGPNIHQCIIVQHNIQYMYPKNVDQEAEENAKSDTLDLPRLINNGNPLQYSCLENPMDRGAWQAAVHGVAKSQTRLSDFTFTFHFHALKKEMATHSSVLAWRIPGTGEPGGLPSMGWHRVGHD
ncbi:hypothetical protein MG293_001916 [Ovis ammon polii]|uniref:Uncharacterized protein n=1 Tax=Ovis ammon polii TaxID=230172 RepID=A0AAD4UQA7_OVIAM|nr:hypothetical protein MG293_001916 [Ovis ammon polii]